MTVSMHWRRCMQIHFEVAMKWRLTSGRYSAADPLPMHVRRVALALSLRALRLRCGCDTQVKEAVPDYVKFVSIIRPDRTLNLDCGTLLRSEPSS